VFKIYGHELKIYYVAFRYPTDLAAGSAWERAEARRHHGDLVSIFRLGDHESDLKMAVAISEDAIPVRTARRLLAPGGEGYQPDEDLLRRLLLRRIRVTAEAGRKSGDVMQRGRYGKAGGAELDQSGQLRPRKRPQG
jgi:hypothetical protein